MTELIVALLMIVNGEIKEARIQIDQCLAQCLKGKRVAQRGNLTGHVKYQCIKSMAEN